MKKKLTLSIDEAVIQKAKDYAQGTDRSLSELIESTLQRILNGSTINEPDTSYRTQNRKSKNKSGEWKLPEFLRGIAGVAPLDIDYVKDRDMIREERYSKQ
ncbi:DUF6364 family protein [Nonlabens agnitus]|uniref:Antitoxin n=1 Tax=Nonlabens agnitus TaxID=870484 RepID=A0A2S9WV60_9FLAO|nr:DUF6364 family protein [Nonlabens agnitus]PRP67349.1 hypothetical protein BST86_09695 [Nonlabens agnitus]